MKTPKWITDTYYRLFPAELAKKKERERLAEIARKRNERARMLLEHEELLEQRNLLYSKLLKDAEGLQNFSNLLSELAEGGFEERMQKRSAKSKIRNFDISKLPDFEEAQEDGIRYEKLVFRVFAMRKKLGLLRLDQGIDEREEDEEKISQD